LFEHWLNSLVQGKKLCSNNIMFDNPVVPQQ